MDFDSAVSLRIVNNERLRRAVHWADYVDLRGALVVTSEAPMPDANCVESFAAQQHRLDALLDIGFALLRAYDRTPAVRLTPLDRPKGIDRALRSRRLEVAERSVAMAFRGDATALAENREITIRIAGPDDVMTFRDIVAPASAPSWLRTMMRRSIIASMSVRSHTLYIGSIDGQPAGTLELVCEGATAGIYAVATLKSQRRRGVQTAMLARAIRDAQAGGCDVIGLRTPADGDARRLFERVGFEVAHDQTLWTAPEEI